MARQRAGNGALTTAHPPRLAGTLAADPPRADARPREGAGQRAREGRRRSRRRGRSARQARPASAQARAAAPRSMVTRAARRRARTETSRLPPVTTTTIGRPSSAMRPAATAATPVAADPSAMTWSCGGEGDDRRLDLRLADRHHVVDQIAVLPHQDADPAREAVGEGGPGVVVGEGAAGGQGVAQRGRGLGLHRDHAHPREARLQRHRHPGDEAAAAHGHDHGADRREGVRDLQRHRSLAGGRARVVKGVDVEGPRARGRGPSPARARRRRCGRPTSTVTANVRSLSIFARGAVSGT